MCVTKQSPRRQLICCAKNSIEMSGIGYLSLVPESHLYCCMLSVAHCIADVLLHFFPDALLHLFVTHRCSCCWTISNST